MSSSTKGRHCSASLMLLSYFSARRRTSATAPRTIITDTVAWLLGETSQISRRCRALPGVDPSLIPEAIAQGMIGHSFNCPDMIGGG